MMSLFCVVHLTISVSRISDFLRRFSAVYLMHAAICSTYRITRYSVLCIVLNRSSYMTLHRFVLYCVLCLSYSCFVFSAAYRYSKDDLALN